MLRLKDSWDLEALETVEQQKIAARQQGWNYLKSLESQLHQNPKFFENYTARDITETLKKFNKCNLNESEDLKKNVLAPLYKSYKIRDNHEFRAWDFDKRVELMKRLADISDLDFQLRENRFETLVKLHHLHAEVYGFEPDHVETFVKKPKTPLIVHKDGETTYGYIITHGSRDPVDDVILLNTFFPDQPQIPSKFYWLDVSKIAGLIFHEGRHAHQAKMKNNPTVLQSREFQDIATLMELSSFGDYYLNNGNEEDYKANPSEQDAYDFQQDMEAFIKASPERRKTLIFEMEARRDAHYKLASLTQRPQEYKTSPAFEIAA